MNKSGIQLSINFVVILIIAVFVFVLGLNFAYKIFFLAEEMKTNLDAETRAHIEAMLDTGAIVGIPVNRAKVEVGDSNVFGLGVNNDGSIIECNIYSFDTFVVDMVFTIAIDKNGAEIGNPPVVIDNWYLTGFREYTIFPGDGKKVPLPVAVKRSYDDGRQTQRGTYSFTVKVHDCNQEQYGSTQKVYVEVI